MEQQIKESPAFKLNGFVMLVIVGAISLIGAWYLWNSVHGLETLLQRGLKIADFIDDALAEGIAWLTAILLVVVIPLMQGAKLSKAPWEWFGEALNRLSQDQMIDLDDERKASMINNLLVVLTSEQTAQPVINTGTLYN